VLVEKCGRGFVTFEDDNRWHHSSFTFFCPRFTFWR